MQYQNAKIYQIRNHSNDLGFIGGTCQPLSRRMAGHRDALNSPKQMDSPIHVAMAELGVESFYIELVEAFPCDSKEQLNVRIGHHIREANSFNEGYNGKIVGRTIEQWNADNPDYTKTHYDINAPEIIEYQHRYREKNAAKIHAPIKCDCGGKYTPIGRSQHFKSIKHQRYLALIPVQEEVVPEVEQEVVQEEVQN